MRVLIAKSLTPKNMEQKIGKGYRIIENVVKVGAVLFGSLVVSVFSTDSGDTTQAIPAFLVTLTTLSFFVFGDRLFQSEDKKKMFRVVRVILVGIVFVFGEVVPTIYFYNPSQAISRQPLVASSVISYTLLIIVVSLYFLFKRK